MDIILLEPEHEGNVGAVCRAMANFEFKNLIIINPKCDLQNDEFYRRAKHSKGKIKIKQRKTIPKYDTLIGTTSKVFSDYNIKRTPITPEQLAKKKLKKAAILFGREGIGLTNEEIDKCDLLITINTSKKYSALNLSHSVAIILYELSKKQSGVTQRIIPADKEDRKQLTKSINNIISKTKFQTKDKQIQQKTIWKNIFNKAFLTKREAHGALGLLRKLKK